MIKFFSLWAEQIILAVIITSLVEMILPDSKNKKYVKIVMGIYILFNIISPIINEKDLFSIDNLSLESYATINSEEESKEIDQTSMDERIQQLYIEELEKNIKTKVEDEGYNVHSCKVDAVLHGDENQQGINKIILTVSKKKNVDDDNQKDESKSNIQSVNKVEINVGLDKFFSNNSVEDEQENYSNSDVTDRLRNSLSEYYQLDRNKIYIKIL